MQSSHFISREQSPFQQGASAVSRGKEKAISPDSLLFHYTISKNMSNRQAQPRKRKIEACRIMSGARVKSGLFQGRRAKIYNHSIGKTPGQLFAAVPDADYLKLMEHADARPDEEVLLPHEVVKMSTLGGMSLVRAWREHLGMTQEEVAKRMGITQPAYAKIEGGKTKPRMATCKRMAAAMGIEWEQLTE